MLRFVLAAAVFSLSALALPAGGVSPAIAEDTIFRCGAESVSIGDSRYTVQKICGKPSRSESVGQDQQGKKTEAAEGIDFKILFGKSSEVVLRPGLR